MRFEIWIISENLPSWKDCQRSVVIEWVDSVTVDSIQNIPTSNNFHWSKSKIGM